MRVLAAAILASISVFCFAGAAFASEVTCTVEERSGFFGSFVPPQIGSTVTIDSSKNLPSVLGFSGHTYIALGSEVTPYTSSRIIVGYKIGVRRDNPESP